jgi:hypothetical protein
MADTLYASVPGFDDFVSINVATQHQQSVATATIQCQSTTKDIGDEVNIDLGYVGNHGHIFKGYVKQIERSTPNGTYQVTCHDVLSRAVDYFFVPDNPDAPFRRANIKAEDLVEDVLREAGLTSFDFDATSFTFAVTAGVYAEVKLVSAYDYANGITDVISWHMWANNVGTIKLKNRKPYWMAAGSPESSQPGYTADTALKTISDGLGGSGVLQASYFEHERDLRNRIVVHGTPGTTAIATASSPYLPAGYYKSAALYWPILDSQSIADKAASYNLSLLNRLSVGLGLTIIGDHELLAHDAVHATINKLGIDDDFYIYYAEHNWSAKGYTTTLELRAKE